VGTMGDWWGERGRGGGRHLGGRWEGRRGIGGRRRGGCDGGRGRGRGGGGGGGEWSDG